MRAHGYRRLAIVIGVAASGALIAASASANFRSVHDPRGDTGCDHGPCSASDKRRGDIVRATAGHEDGKLRHTIRVVGKFDHAFLRINTDSDADCEFVLGPGRGPGLDREYFSRKVRECGQARARTGRARMDFHRHSVEIVFSERSIGNPQSYGWSAINFGGTHPGYSYDGVPNGDPDPLTGEPFEYGIYIPHRLG